MFVVVIIVFEVNILIICVFFILFCEFVVLVDIGCCLVLFRVIEVLYVEIVVSVFVC